MIYQIPLLKQNAKTGQGNQGKMNLYNNDLINRSFLHLVVHFKFWYKNVMIFVLYYLQSYICYTFLHPKDINGRI